MKTLFIEIFIFSLILIFLLLDFSCDNPYIVVHYAYYRSITYEHFFFPLTQYVLWNELDDLSMQDVKNKIKSYYDMVWHLFLVLVITCKFFAFF